MAMTHDRILLDRVSLLRTRVRLLITQQWLCVGLTAGLLISLLLVAATKLLWWTDAIDYMWVAVAAGAVVGALYGWLRPVASMDAAQIADERAGLKERLSTAVELSRLPTRSEVAEVQIADAAKHAQGLRPAEVLPWKPPPQWRYAAAALGLLMAAIYVPDLPIFHSAQDQKDREAIRMEGERLQKVAKQMEKQLPKSADENAAILRRIQQQMKQLGKDMRNNRIPKKQAMLQANQLQKELKEAENKLAGGKSQKAMEQVAADLLQSARQKDQQGNSEAAKALRRMAENVSKRDMDAAQKQLEELAQKLKSGQMNADDAQKAADALEQMAKAMQGSNLDKASEEMKDAAQKLQQAAEAAKQFQQKMADAKTDAERQQLQEQMQQAMQGQMAQAGDKCAQAGGT